MFCEHITNFINARILHTTMNEAIDAYLQDDTFENIGLLLQTHKNEYSKIVKTLFIDVHDTIFPVEEQALQNFNLNEYNNFAAQMRRVGVKIILITNSNAHDVRKQLGFLNMHEGVELIGLKNTENRYEQILEFCAKNNISISKSIHIDNEMAHGRVNSKFLRMINKTNNNWNAITNMI